jgi:hypothetical protein
MPFMPYNLLILFLSKVLLGVVLTADEFPSSFHQSPVLTDPLRFEQSDGADVVFYSKNKTPIPLCFPKALSLDEYLDNSVLSFYPLRDLARNPLLKNNFPLKTSQIPQKEFDFISKSVLSARERKVFDSSQLLIPRRVHDLPSDEQLAKFLAKKSDRTPNPEIQKKIIQNLLRDEYADEPVAGFLGHVARQTVQAKQDVSSKKRVISFSKNLKSEASQKVDSPALSHKTVAQVRTVESTKVGKISSPNETNLNLIARKPSRDGSMHPAQASEIFLTTQDLKELLKDLSVDPAISGEVRSVAELWAKSEKDISRNPEIALGVKSILLSAKVGRARTDPYGLASLRNVSPDDKYFVIGIDKDVDTDVVTIWSKEVEVEPGENLVELTSTDVIYQE